MTPDRMDRLLTLRRLRCDAARAARNRADRKRAEAAARLAEAEIGFDEAATDYDDAAQHSCDDFLGRSISGPSLAYLQHRIDDLARVRDAAAEDRRAKAVRLEEKTRRHDGATQRLARATARYNSWAGERDRMLCAVRSRAELVREDEENDGHAARSTSGTT